MSQTQVPYRTASNHCLTSEAIVDRRRSERAAFAIDTFMSVRNQLPGYVEDRDVVAATLAVPLLRDL